MNTPRNLLLALTAAILLTAANANAAGITNGSFETGDFTGWISTDIGFPFDPQVVASAGTTTQFNGFLGPNVGIPTDGDFAVSNGFDGGGPDVILLSQDIGVINAGDALMFDYRAGWDLIGFASGTLLDRFFNVLIEPAGGGASIFDTTILTAEIGTDTSGTPNSDTGPLTALIDLTAFAGTDARLTFQWVIPEDFTGPANAQLDNVKIVSNPIPAPAALPAGIALFGMLGLRRKNRNA